MASIWKIGTVDVYVDESDSERSPQIAELVPIGATGSSILHQWATPAEERSLQAYVFTETNKSSLEAYVDALSSVTLTSDQGSQGTFYITSISFKRVNHRRVDVPGVPTDATAYKANFTLKKVV